MMLTDLAAVLRLGGLSVIELPGWKTRGHGPMTAVRGVTVHHTASGRGTGAQIGLNTVRYGRADLPGPLAQLYLNREGVFFVVAAGLAYHAGKSREIEQTNTYRIGIEALAAGDGWSQDWPPAQMRALTRGCAVLAEHYRFPVGEILGHKETCAPVGRKIDPSFDMTEFRQQVKDVDQMQLSDPVKYTASAAERAGKEFDTVGHVLQWPPAVRFARDEIAIVRSEVALIREQLAALQSTATQQAALITDLIGLLRKE